MELIRKRIEESIDSKKALLEDIEVQEAVKNTCDAIIESYKNGGCIFFAGNGGSAADAQHLAAELVVRFYLNRKGLAAQALTVDTSILTACSNDFSFDDVFSRQLEANSKKGDVFVGISTSGNSGNVVRAVEKCKELGVKTVIFTGSKNGKLDEMGDIVIKVPSVDTPRIQEMHILLGHIICEIVEKEMADMQ